MNNVFHIASNDIPLASGVSVHLRNGSQVYNLFKQHNKLDLETLKEGSAAYFTMEKTTT